MDEIAALSFLWFLWVAHLLTFLCPSLFPISFCLPCDGFGHQFLLNFFGQIFSFEASIG